MVEHLALPNDGDELESLIFEEFTADDGTEGIQLTWLIDGSTGVFLDNDDCEKLHAWLSRRITEQTVLRMARNVKKYREGII